ncbi:hypothetical protein [Pendulispora albinea]|uniref:Uncharacterized protein n=1 Tax=Pendulispora albinea TaxID=2741071 RepID=A0ABZ2LW47_9BACT
MHVDRSAAFPRVKGSDIPVLHDDSERDERTCVRPDLGSSGVIASPRRIYTATPPQAIASSPPPPVIPKVVGPLRVSSRRPLAPAIARPDVSGKVRAMHLVAEPPRRSWALRLAMSVVLGVLVGGLVIAFFAHGGEPTARELLETLEELVHAPREMLGAQSLPKAPEAVALQAPSALASGSVAGPSASGSGAGTAVSAPATGESSAAPAPGSALPQLPSAGAASAGAASASAGAASASAGAAAWPASTPATSLPVSVKPLSAAPAKTAAPAPPATVKAEAAKPEATGTASMKKANVKAERKSEKPALRPDKPAPAEKAEKPQKASAGGGDDKPSSGKRDKGNDDKELTAKERALAEAAKKLADRQIQQSLAP